MSAYSRIYSATQTLSTTGHSCSRTWNLCSLSTSLRSIHSSFSMNCNNTREEKANTSASIWNIRRNKAAEKGLVFVNEEVRAAVAEGKPVVALESAIITHGMPAPHNLITAMKLEEIIRQKGCIPATAGLIRGRLTVGVSAAQLYLLADPHITRHKISTRDLPYASMKKVNGGTTVSTTLLASRLAGIDIFVTGGIGGVHKPGSASTQTWDVSADLIELGQSAGVAVVCSGIKSILDIPATLEYLETQGVSATVLDPSLPLQGDTSKQVYFPDFFTRNSGVVATSYISDPADAARMIINAKELNLRQGLVFAVPIPVTEEPAGAEIKKAIEDAVGLATANAVSGRDVTPYVLSQVLRMTKGQSLSANSALIRNNASVGADVALALCELKKLNSQNSPSKFVPSGLPLGEDSRASFRASEGSRAPGVANPEVVVVGGSIVDFIATVKEPNIEHTGRTHEGAVTQGSGGVGRNIAECLTRFAVPTLLLSAVGDDAHARTLAAQSPPGLFGAGILQQSTAPTASYCTLLDCRGEALMGIGDMEAHNCITPQWIFEFRDQLKSSRLVVCDGNIPQVALDCVLRMCGASGVPVWFEPTDVRKAHKPWVRKAAEEDSTGGLAFASPNLNELRAICNFLDLGEVLQLPSDPAALQSFLEHIVTIATPLFTIPLHDTDQHRSDNKGSSRTPEHQSIAPPPVDDLSVFQRYTPPMKALMVTLGREGFLLVRVAAEGAEDSPLLPTPNPAEGDVVGLHFPSLPVSSVVSVSGAGDCLASGFMAAMLRGWSVSECAMWGATAALQSLCVTSAVPPVLGSLPDMEERVSLPYCLVRT